MAKDSVQLGSAYVGSTIKAIYREANANQVLNTTLNSNTGGFEAWQDGHYTNYLVSASPQGSSGFFDATTPSAMSGHPYIVTWVKSVDGTLANDVILFSIGSNIDGPAGGGFGQAVEILANLMSGNAKVAANGDSTFNLTAGRYAVRYAANGTILSINSI